MHYLPFVFRNSANDIIRSDPPPENSRFSELSFIENELKTGTYTDIFVIHDGNIDFRGKSNAIKLKEETVIDGDSDDLLDRSKRVIGKKSKPLVHVYHFKLKY